VSKKEKDVTIIIFSFSLSYLMQKKSEPAQPHTFAWGMGQHFAHIHCNNEALLLSQNNAIFLRTICNNDGRICDSDGDWLTICLILGSNSVHNQQIS
jgi:hypothetical protein